MSGYPDVDVITLEGELDISCREQVAAALRVDGTGPAILLDFSRVTYADSTVISELLRFRRDAQRAQRRIALLIGNRQFARLIEYAGIAELLPVYHERETAQQALVEKDAS
ncbi:MAG TPA: STAS domain-containing protein [Candidatus Limnocylindria bacterium]|nr:STAS domain-containing protein [Candidatus Limnocylindria bacterium]